MEMTRWRWCFSRGEPTGTTPTTARVSTRRPRVPATPRPWQAVGVQAEVASLLRLSHREIMLPQARAMDLRCSLRFGRLSSQKQEPGDWEGGSWGGGQEAEEEALR